MSGHVRASGSSVARPRKRRGHDSAKLYAAFVASWLRGLVANAILALSHDKESDMPSRWCSRVWAALVLVLVISAVFAQEPAPQSGLFNRQEVMIPMRDGVRLQNGHLHSEERRQAAAVPAQPHALRRSRRRAVEPASPRGAAGRRLHLRLPEPARQVQVRRAMGHAASAARGQRPRRHR